MHELRANKQALILILVSILSSILGFVLSVTIARMLGPKGFQEYIVAIAAISVLGTCCEFGTGKFALKAIPQYTQLEQWNLASGYVRFCLGIVLCFSTVMMLLVLSIEFGHDGKLGNYPLGIAILFLPSTALVAAVAELVMANRAPILGTAVTKLLCPFATMAFILCVYAVTGKLTTTSAILCFGAAGIVGLTIAVGMFFKTAANQYWRVQPVKDVADWIQNCAWFFVLAFVMSWLFDIGVLVLEFANVPHLEIALYGAAAKTGCFILLVAKSTNKLYQPEVSILLSTEDWEKALSLRKARLILIGTTCLLFVSVMVLFGKPILRLFGDEYVAAHLCLIFVSTGAAFTTLFAMAPEFLKFVDEAKTVLVVQIGCAVLLFTLTWWLGSQHGATGAGAAFCIAMVMTTSLFVWLSKRKMREIVSGETNAH